MNTIHAGEFNSDATVITPAVLSPQVGDTRDSLLAKVASQINARSFGPSVSFTRPADTTAYTALDIVGAASAHLSFTPCGRPGAALLIRSAQLLISATSVPAGMTTFRLHLFNAAPDAVADNAVWTLASAGDIAKYQGFLDFTAPADMGSALWSQVNGLNHGVQLATDSAALVGLLQTTAGWTPAASTAIKVALQTECP
jgi:hypothetical protein